MRRLELLVLLVLGASGAVTSAYADKLSEFKEADKYEEGCVTIPTTYGHEREACESEGPKVHEWCDGGRRGPVTCGSEEETRRPKRDIENAEKRIADLKDRKSRAESNKSNAQSEDEKRKFDEEIKQIEQDLDQADKDLEVAKNALAARKKLVEDAIYTLDQCITYRRAVMNSFAAALDRMRNENETPEIKDVATSLAKKYEESKSGHNQQIKAKENAMQNCRDWRP